MYSSDDDIEKLFNGQFALKTKFKLLRSKLVERQNESNIDNLLETLSNMPSTSSKLSTAPPEKTIQNNKIDWDEFKFPCNKVSQDLAELLADPNKVFPNYNFLNQLVLLVFNEMRANGM